jgi:hypothetical protein
VNGWAGRRGIFYAWKGRHLAFQDVDPARYVDYDASESVMKRDLRDTSEVHDDV